MVTSYNTQTEIKEEIERLKILIATLEYDLLCFVFGSNSMIDISKTENELFFYEIQLKDALKRHR